MSKASKEMTLERAMFFAVSPGGLSGESQRIMPASYIVENDGLDPMSPRLASLVDQLLALGWVERVEKTIAVSADNDWFSMFRGMPAHTLISVTYVATEKGRMEWSKAA